MPPKQLSQALAAELGDDWRSKVDDFQLEPLAAASIGQVSLPSLTARPLHPAAISLAV